jgi:hypothetical protein
MYQARDLGQGLQRLRSRKGLTRFQAAEVVGLPHLVYAWLEHGRLTDDESERRLADAWWTLQTHELIREA